MANQAYIFHIPAAFKHKSGRLQCYYAVYWNHKFKRSLFIWIRKVQWRDKSSLHHRLLVHAGQVCKVLGGSKVLDMNNRRILTFFAFTTVMCTKSRCDSYNLAKIIAALRRACIGLRRISKLVTSQLIDVPERLHGLYLTRCSVWCSTLLWWKVRQKCWGFNDKVIAGGASR